MTQSSDSLFFLVLAIFGSFAYSAYDWKGRLIALRAVNETLHLYRLATNDPPDSTCRKWSWIRCSTSNLFTWKEDKEDFLSDPSTSYFGGGITTNTRSGGLLVLAEHKKCPRVSSEEKGCGLPSEAEDGVRVFSAADDTQALEELQLSEPVDSTLKGSWGAFELNGQTFWGFTPDGGPGTFLESISVNQKNVVERSFNGYFYIYDSETVDGVKPAELQVVQVNPSVDLLSVLELNSTEYCLGRMNGLIPSFKLKDWNAERQRLQRFDEGSAAQRFVLTNLGSDVFAVGQIHYDREKLSAKEVWRNGMTLIRKIELDGNHIIQKPVGLDRELFDSTELGEETSLKGKMSFDLKNKGVLVLNLTFHHPENFKDGGYEITLSDGVDDKEVVYMGFNLVLPINDQHYSFSVLTPKGGSVTDLSRASAFSGNVLAVVGPDVIEVYLEGGKHVLTIFNSVDNRLTKVTISPLGQGELTLKEASYKTFGLSGTSSEAVDAAAGQVDNDDSGSSGRTSSTPAVRGFLDSVRSVAGPLDAQTSDSATLAKTISAGARGAWSWVYSVACSTILMWYGECSPGTVLSFF